MNMMAANTNIALLQAGQAQVKTPQSLEMEKVAAAAQEFEAVFISEMMKPMFEGISTEAPFRGGKGEEIFRSLLLQEYGKIVSQAGGMGMADSVKSQMIQMQEQANLQR